MVTTKVEDKEWPLLIVASVAKRLKRPRASTPSATIIVSPEPTLSAFDDAHHDQGSHDDGDVDGDGDVARKLNGPILWACHRTGLRCEGEIHSSDVRSASSGRSALPCLLLAGSLQSNRKPGIFFSYHCESDLFIYYKLGEPRDKKR